MRLRTWWVEGGVVAASLVGALVASGRWHDWREWVCALGVQLGFHHASVANRLQEAEEERARERRRAEKVGEMCSGEGGRCQLVAGHKFPCFTETTTSGTEGVVCVRWLSRYWVLKEVAWVVYFFSIGAVSALVGCAVFLLHPFWRRWYRGRFPRGRRPDLA